MRYTVFLDRDGVINYDSSDYIKKSNEFYFIPESAEAVALLCKNNFNIIVITNQSVIGRKMGTLDDLEAIFAKMRKGVEVCGGEIKDIFFCPHTPDENCSCRKPKPGLIFQAMAKYKIDPACSCMVGDSAKDIECANNAGCGCSLLVQTGNGKKAAAELEKKAIKPDFTGVNLMACAQWICENLKKSDAVL
ncbi:MAG: D-glycero-beta-D-manno-heptose 1,7-bisphosphate 7-phosphatase [Thermodesulfobacteriota bacterium]|nr:D-glycero-beta-D-manno-heptose 1,7-bisphosphate 7-phosphatase [Thermodesulfobacteriota bacterium]